MRERVDRLRLGDAGVDQVLEPGLDQTEAVARLDLPPGRPAEDGRRVQECDLADLGLAADIEEELEPGDQGLQGSGTASASVVKRSESSASICSNTAANSPALPSKW